MSSAPDRDLDWLLENLLAATPGTRHALVLSADGLKLCHTAGLSTDRADQLAAIASGLQSLAHGASIEFGDGSGGVRQSMTEFHGGILCIVAAGEGAHLAVVTDDDADVGVVGHNMHGLIEQIGVHLSAPARGSADGGEDGAEHGAGAEERAADGAADGSAATPEGAGI